MSFVLLPNLKISSAGAPGAAQPAEDPTVWVKADDLDGSSNSTLTAGQGLADVTNHGTVVHDFEGQSNPPTYSTATLTGSSQYINIDSISFTGVSDNGLHMASTSTIGDIIQNDTWEVFAAARSTNWPSTDNEYRRARLFGDGPGTFWGLLAVNDDSVDKWSGFLWDGNESYARGTGSNDTDQIIRYRGEDVGGTVKQYLKVDDNPESPATDAPNAISGMTNNPRIGDTRGTGDTEYEGKVHEILVYDRVLTAQERTDTYDYLYAKWFNKTLIPFPTPDFDPPDNSTVSNFEFSGWPGTVANPITSSDFATYDNSATASFELGPWEFSFGTGSLSTQYEFAQGWPGTLDIGGILETEFTASLHSASTTYEFDGWPGTTDPPT